jgi:hypothetical protein
MKTASLNTNSQDGQQGTAACGEATGTRRTGPNSRFASCTFQNKTSAGSMALPFVRTRRKTREEMSEALDQALALPLPATSCFYILDKIQRLGASEPEGVTLADLEPHFTNPTLNLPARLDARARQCVDKRYLVRTETPERTRFVVTALASRFVRKAKDARIQLWKLTSSPPFKDGDSYCTGLA